MLLTRAHVDYAKKRSPWDLGNQVLYDLCQRYPKHRDVSAVIAKVWLIGRSYAAAIERRRETTEQNDDFYVEKVGPAIIRSDIDAWIRAATVHESMNEASAADVLLAHSKVTQLFSEISGLEKRSLASKYLHFHQPNLFYIYDTRAVEAMRKLSPVVGRASNGEGTNDNEYRKLVEKCMRLKLHIKERFDVALARIFHTETRNEVGGIMTSHVESVVETDRRGDSADAKLYRDPSAVCEARTA